MDRIKVFDKYYKYSVFKLFKLLLIYRYVYVIMKTIDNNVN